METSVKIPVIDITGKSLGDFAAASELFAIEPNEAVVHFVCEGQRFRFWKRTAVAKTRAAVRGGGAKIRKQKGGGTSRQGGNRAPQWVGGGVVFGPTGIKREFKINKKVRRLALASVLSDRYSGGQVRVLSAELKVPKTQPVSKFLTTLSLKGARVGFVVSASETQLVRSVRNLRNVDLLTEEQWTPLDFVKTDSLIFTKTALESLTKRNS